MYIGNLIHLDCKIHLLKFIILVTTIKFKSKIYQFNHFNGLWKWPQKKRSLKLNFTTPLQGFPWCGGGGAWGVSPHPTIFFETPPLKLMPPHGATPCLHLKMKPPIWKTNAPPPLPLKRKAPFHEMIPGKSTINNNLNLIKIVQKYVWKSLFLVNLQPCRRQLYYQMNTVSGIFRQHFKPLAMLPPCIDLSSHPSDFEESPLLPKCSQHLWETLPCIDIQPTTRGCK